MLFKEWVMRCNVNFADILKYYENNSKLNRKQLIAKIQIYHDDFSNIDETTFSRWINHITEPSFRKQLLISSYFDKSLYHFINNINLPVIPNKIINAYDSLLINFDHSHHRMSYSPLPMNNLTLEYSELTAYEHRSVLGDFYQNLDSYKIIFNNIPISKHKAKTCLFSIKHHNEMISHSSFTLNFEKFYPYIKKLNFIPSKNSILVNVGFFSNSKHYELLNGIILNHIINNFHFTSEIYYVSRGNIHHQLHSILSGDIVLSHKENSNLGDVFITKFNFIKLISNPLVFNTIVKTKSLYKSLKESKNISIDSF